MNAYCVILCRRPVLDVSDHPRIKRFYVGAPTADYALRAASDQHPQFRVMGIEHSDLYPRLIEASAWQAA
ncbi:MAG TPA: hypothetical protein VMB49_11505 [Acidobacteriaceae bacterium]|nr:hypothetical protein [Acidobacteriaceae bacterium]